MMVMKRWLIVCVSIVLLGLAGCTSWLMPKPVESESFSTLGGGFMATIESGKAANIRYGVNLLVKKDLPSTGYMVVTFEDPANKSELIVEEGTVQDMQEKYASSVKNVLAFYSPYVEGVRKHTQYEVSVSVFSDSGKQKLLASHKQKVGSTVWGK